MFAKIGESRGFDQLEGRSFTDRKGGSKNFETVEEPKWIESYSVSTVHIDVGVQNLVLGYLAGNEFFGEDAVVPVIRSDKKSDKYWKYSLNKADINDMGVRADLDESVGGSLDVSNSTFTTIVYAYHIDLGDQTDANYDSPLNLQRDIARHLMRKVVLKTSGQFAAKFMATGIWTTDVTPTPKWDTAGTDIIGQVLDAREAFFKRNGVMANVGFITSDAIRACKSNTAMVARSSVTVVPGMAGRVTEDIIQELFELNRMIILRSVYNTTTNGTGHTLDYFNSEKMLLVHISEGGLLNEQNAMCKFEWSGYEGSPVGVTAERIPLKRGTRFEIEYAFVFEVLNSSLGTLLNNLLST